jgi:hypothetical protein
MENSKKVILIIIILSLFLSCKHKITENLLECKDCESIKKDSLLFIDKKNNVLFIRVKSVYLNPSLLKKIKANNYRSYYKYVYLYPLEKSVSLKELIDIKTFKKIDVNGNYFEDKNFVYFTPYMPVGNYFNLIDKKEYVKFSLNKDTLYSKYGTFYRGVLINTKKQR